MSGFLPQPITLQSIFRKERSFGPIDVQVIISENASDVLTITKQPVQIGASITDHAYKEPTTLSMQILFTDNLFTSLADIYAQLLDLQMSRDPIDVITPKRVYSSMLIATLGQTTDKNTENILSIAISFQQIILVQVATTTVPRSRQKNPGASGATLQAGKKSVLLSLIQGVVGLFH